MINSYIRACRWCRKRYDYGKARSLQNGNQTIESERKENQVVNGVPCVYSIEDAKAMVLERGREIKAGHVKMIPHEEVMREMEQLLANYAD